MSKLLDACDSPKSINTNVIELLNFNTYNNKYLIRLKIDYSIPHIHCESDLRCLISRLLHSRQMMGYEGICFAIL